MTLFDLLPVHPVRDGMGLLPELTQNIIIGIVFLQHFVQIGSVHPAFLGSSLSNNG